MRINLLGGFEIAIDGSCLLLADLRPQVRQLLRVLALPAGDAMHRERLAELMWPSQHPSDGIHRLQVALSALRRAMGDDLGSGPGPRIVREGECYRLQLTPASRVDVLDFRAALARARSARRTGDGQAEAAALQEALDLYGGDLLPEDGPAEWVVEERELLRSQASAAATALAELLSERDPRGAVAASERGLILDPYNDAAWQHLIGLHERLGDLARAERARTSYHDVLHELGVEAVPGRSGHSRVRNSTSAMATRWPSST
jgi:DNA-binding SARP family transcriptional activator